MDSKSTVKIGDVFERLTVIEGPWLAKKGNQMASKVKVECSCGGPNKYKEVFVNALRSGGRCRTRSCGCWKAEKASGRMTDANLAGKNKHPTHNMSRTRLYRIYYSMKNRCYYNKDASYKHYGARGIKVCEDWKTSFTTFAKWALDNGYDDNLTIERRNINKDYCPENCEFATIKVQANNTSRNHYMEAFGEKKTLAIWKDDQRCVVDYNTLRYRVLYYGWTPEDALSTPSIRN